MSIPEIQEKIKNNKSLAFYEKNELKYVQKPLGKAIYKNNNNTKKNINCDPNDKIECPICKIIFSRSNRSKHNKTKIHQVYEKINIKLRDFIID